MVLLSVFFPTFGLLLYYNTQAALKTTTRTLRRTQDHHAYTQAHTQAHTHAYTHAHRRTYTHTHTHIHAYTWWAHDLPVDASKSYPKTLGLEPMTLIPVDTVDNSG